MNVIKTGNNYHINNDIPEISDTLPNGTYEINFGKMTGFYLTLHNDLTVKENKIYGNIDQKVDKILNSFVHTDRNFGVILSGAKGVGKSLFARRLAQKATEQNLPLLICDTYIPGIASFISSIDQEIIVLFDEFEKTFAPSEEQQPQDEMLSLFDGIDCGKKIFVITCNEINKLSNYLLNRPGRFHYHFALGNPNPNEIEEYMHDKLDAAYYNYIPQIIGFSFTGNLTYDCLRAIAFELNNGYSLEETISDLNISRENYLYFDFTVEFDNGDIAERHGAAINYSNETSSVWFPNSKIGFNLFFNNRDIIFDSHKVILKLKKENVNIVYDEDEVGDNEITKAELETYKCRKIKNIILVRAEVNNIQHYAI